MSSNSFADSGWPARFAKMGDEAEELFREVYGKPFIERGLRRPPIKVSGLPLRERCAPDFLGSDEYVEAMGVGKDQMLKLKLDKWLGLSLAAVEFPLKVFIWDSHKKRYGYIDFKALTDVIHKGVKLGQFKEGKHHYLIPLESLGLEWTTHKT